MLFTAGGGADSSQVRAQLVNVVDVVAASDSFAALRSDGTVVFWGISGPKLEQLVNVAKICSNWGAFAALKHEGTVVTWGGSSRAPN